MKKFLLTCAVVLGIGAFASADEATFIAPDFTDMTGTKLVNKDGSSTQGSNTNIDQSLCGIEFTAGNITIKFEKAESQNYPGAYSNHVRWFQGANIIVTPTPGTTIEKIYVKTVSNSKGNFSAKVGESTVGEVSGSGSGASNPITWTGSVNDEMTLSAIKQVRFSYITFTYTVGEAPKVVKPVITPNGGWVKAGDEITITCDTEGAEIYYTLDGDTPDKSSDKYTGAIKVEETEDFTLTAVAYVGEDVSSAATANFKIIPVLSALNEIMEQTKGTQVIVDTEVIVTYKNGAYNYIYDANGYCYGLIYQYDFAPAVGDKIAAGWTATVDNYNGLWQFKSPEGCTVTESGAELPEPMPSNGYMFEYTTAAFGNQYMQLEGVTFEAATPATKAAFTGTLVNEDKPEGYITVNFYNQFQIASVEPGTYTVTGYVSVYEKEGQPTVIQILPIAFETYEDPSSKLYIAGPFNNWDLNEAPAMEYDGVNTWTYTANFTTEKAFSISFLLGEEDWDWGSYVPAGNQITVGETTPLEYPEDDCKITFEGADGEYKITVVKNEDGSYSMVLTSTSGIADIEAAQGAPRFFNLQGVEVANPSTGIYIRVAGGKASKVFVD